MLQQVGSRSISTAPIGNESRYLPSVSRDIDEAENVFEKENWSAAAKGAGVLGLALGGAGQCLPELREVFAKAVRTWLEGLYRQAEALEEWFAGFWPTVRPEAHRSVRQVLRDVDRSGQYVGILSLSALDVRTYLSKLLGNPFITVRFVHLTSAVCSVMHAQLKVRRPGRWIFSGYAVRGAAFLLLTFAHSLWMLAIVAMLLGIGYVIGGVRLTTVLQMKSPENMLGKVLAAAPPLAISPTLLLT